MVVYGVHSVIGTVLGNLLAGVYSKVPTLLYFILAYVTVSILSFTFAYIIKRFIKPINFILSGGR